MPLYTCENGFCGITKTDEEKLNGFMTNGVANGDCVSAACHKFNELTKKFGNHFEIAMLLYIRESCSVMRLMNDKEINDFMSRGKYLIHFEVYNKKTKQYIDTSQDAIKIAAEHLHIKYIGLNPDLNWNVIHRIYHFSLDYFQTYENYRMGAFCVKQLYERQMKGYTDKEENIFRKKGVKILK